MNKFKNQLLLLFFLLPVGSLHGMEGFSLFKPKTTENGSSARPNDVATSNNEVPVSSKMKSQEQSQSVEIGSSDSASQKNLKSVSTAKPTSKSTGFSFGIKEKFIKNIEESLTDYVKTDLGVDISAITDSKDTSQQAVDAFKYYLLSKSGDIVTKINVNPVDNEISSTADLAQQEALAVLQKAVIDKTIEIINSKARQSSEQITGDSQDIQKVASDAINLATQEVLSEFENWVNNPTSAQTSSWLTAKTEKQMQSAVNSGIQIAADAATKKFNSIDLSQMQSDGAQPNKSESYFDEKTQTSVTTLGTTAVNVGTTAAAKMLTNWLQAPKDSTDSFALNPAAETAVKAAQQAIQTYGLGQVIDAVNSFDINSKSQLSPEIAEKIDALKKAVSEQAQKFISQQLTVPEEKSSFSQLKPVKPDEITEQPKSNEQQTEPTARVTKEKLSEQNVDESQPTKSSFFNSISSMFRKQAQSVGNNPEAKASLIRGIVSSVGNFIGLNAGQQEAAVQDIAKNCDPSSKTATNFCDTTIDNKTFNQRFNLWLQKVITRIYAMKDPNIIIVQVPVTDSGTQLSMRYNKGTKQVTSVLVLYQGFSYYVDPTEFLVNKDGTISIPLFDKQSELTFFDKQVYNQAIKKTSAALLKSQATQSKDVQAAIEKGTQMLLASRQQKGTITLQYDGKGVINNTAENQIMDDGAKINTEKKYKGSTVASQTVALFGADYEIFAPDITMNMTNPEGISGQIQYDTETVTFENMTKGRDGIYRTSFSFTPTQPAVPSESEYKAMQTAASNYAVATISGTAVGKLTPAFILAVKNAQPEAYQAAVDFYNAPTMIGIQGVSIAYDPVEKKITTTVTKTMSDGTSVPKIHTYTTN